MNCNAPALTLHYLLDTCLCNTFITNNIKNVPLLNFFDELPPLPLYW